MLEHKARKRLAAESSLTKRPPTQEERLLIHDLYLEYSKYDDPHLKVKTPDDVEWMEDTKMAAIQIMQPQDRNIHDKVSCFFFFIGVSWLARSADKDVYSHFFFDFFRF